MKWTCNCRIPFCCLVELDWRKDTLSNVSSLHLTTIYSVANVALFSSAYFTCSNSTFIYFYLPTHLPVLACINVKFCSPHSLIWVSKFPQICNGYQWDECRWGSDKNDGCCIYLKGRKGCVNANIGPVFMNDKGKWRTIAGMLF